MRKLISNLLHQIFPTKCVFCDKIIKDTHIRICDECMKKISYNKKYCQRCGDKLETQFGLPFCSRCRDEQMFYERVFVPLIYKDSVRDSILKFKFRGRRSFAKTFAVMIFTELRSNSFIPDLVTCVPIHKSRLLRRGYNQSELVAKEVATLLNVPFEKLLKKNVYTPPLYGFSGKERRNIVKNTFSATKDLNYKDKNILLIDDIITTSSTANECSRVLCKNYLCNVYVGTIASTNKK